MDLRWYVGNEEWNPVSTPTSTDLHTLLVPGLFSFRRSGGPSVKTLTSVRVVNV